MLSKYLPWDFLPKHSEIIDRKKTGLYAFLITDPYFERVILDKLPKKEMTFSLYSGNEVTRDFIDEHLINLSFFSATDHIQIMNAENITPLNLSYLEEAPVDWSERFMLLFFTKSNKAFLEFSKSKEVTSIEITEPRFWEGAKLWQFCQKIKGVSFKSDISAFVLDHLEHNFESFFWVIGAIQTNFKEENVTLEQVKGLIKKERWDFFSLIDLFHASPEKFFREVLKKEDRDFEWLRSLFAFMQSHLNKVLFPDDIRAKAKLSKYDEALLEMSEKWSRAEIMHYLKLFGELEIFAKSSDEFILNKLRLEIVK